MSGIEGNDIVTVNVERVDSGGISPSKNESLQEWRRKQKIQLHQLLVQDNDEKVSSSSSSSSSLPFSSPSCSSFSPPDEVEESVLKALQAYGVISSNANVEETWQSSRRMMTSSLLSFPANPSLTTLVPLSSLPKHQRSLYLRRYNYNSIDDSHDDENVLVEIPTAALLPPDQQQQQQQQQQSSNLAIRPLSGNLSNKLVEYTRGQVGKRRPFPAGGMDEPSPDIHIHNNNDHDSNHDYEDGDSLCDDYCTPQEILNARHVLDEGAAKAWKDGTLITSPPGVTFSVGIDFRSVYGERVSEDLGSKGACAVDAGDNDGHNDSDDNDDEEEFKEESAYSVGRQTDVSNPKMVDKMWDKSYFDDDSLFGDHSSDSDSHSDDTSDDDEDDNDVNDDDDSNNNNGDTINNDGQNNKIVHDTVKKEHKIQNNDNIDTSAVSTDLDDVDHLLSELAISTKTSEVEKAIHKKQKQHQSSNTSNNNTNNNPIHLLTKQRKLSSKPTSQRPKSYANITPLPIQHFHTLVPNPAITYPFELDDFQKQAVARLERSECIFVAAHTSAGKTVCAEYAIALARKHCTRAIYTSPIKALSNQKYRDFRDTFGDDVGLITGDMQLRADSSCLIMTTEILRSMLYRGADLVRDIEWVIFDEVHYINDTERGVVWEEVIIMLPEYVNLVFLSATTPNTIEFSDWIGRTKRKEVHVIRTDYRPVPLSHFLWGGLKLHKVMEGRKGSFLEKGWKECGRALMPAKERERIDAAKAKVKAGKKTAGNNHNAGKGSSAGGAGRQTSTGPGYKQSTGSKQFSWQQSGNKQDWTSLVKFLEREGLMPTVVFSFSKKKCEEIANMLRSLNLNTAAEKNSAHAFAIQTMGRLSPNDSSLPQVLNTCEMVKRGIGVHHGGLLPILKEMVEILFSRNLIKVLFATETFAMGVNMPARAVVFNSIRKHDGTQFRVLEPGEYTQMAGRAGRRGLDKVGTVIMCCFGDQPPPNMILRNMLTGSSTKLQSQFRLTYNMILNLLRVEDMSVEGMIKRSFSEFATQRALATNEYPKLLERGMKTLAKLDENFKQDSDTRIGSEDIEEYYAASSELLSVNMQMLSYLLTSAGGTGGGALVSGRIVLVTAARKRGYVHAPALIVKPPIVSSGSSTGTDNKNNSSSSMSKPAVCIVLLPESYVPSDSGEECETSHVPKPAQLNYVGSSKNRRYAIHEIDLDEILFVSSIKHKVDSNELYQEKSNSPHFDSFAKAKPMGSRHGDGFDPFAGMVPSGKRGLIGKRSTSSSQRGQTVDQVISYLIEAELLEAKSSLGVMDLKECTKGIHQGNETLNFRSDFNKLEGLVSVIRQYQSHYSPSLERHYATVERKETLRSTVNTLRHLLSNESLQLFPDFLQRKALLQTLDYVDDNDTVCVKGRVACEVNTCEELIVTELVFEGILNELEPAEIVAALSALIFQEKSDEELDSELPERLMNTCARMKTIAKNLGQYQKNHGLPIDPDEYCANSLKFGLVHVVYEWALGVPFSNICQLTMVQEGSIVRCITRLDELCREVRNCARVVGNPTLYRKMEDASVAIKRDIVFASSLYVT